MTSAQNNHLKRTLAEKFFKLKLGNNLNINSFVNTQWEEHKLNLELPLRYKAGILLNDNDDDIYIFGGL